MQSYNYCLDKDFFLVIHRHENNSFYVEIENIPQQWICLVKSEKLLMIFINSISIFDHE